MKSFSHTVILALVLCGGTFTSHASSIKVNGTCELGSCSSTDVLAAGQTQTNPFDFTYTFANSDSFHLQGNLAATNQNGFEIGITDFMVTYQGNSFGTASGTDVLVSDFLQYIANSSSYRTTAYEGIGGELGPGLGMASSASGQAIIAGQSLPLLGPYTSPGSFSGYDTASITVPRGTPLLDYRYTLTFGAGSQAGSSISVNPTQSPVPEPATLVMVTTGLLGIARCVRRKHSCQPQEPSSHNSPPKFSDL